jgi:DNA-binding response OmpR family regulator
MPRILVVDNDQSNAEVIQMVLEDQDFEVESICQSDLLNAAVKRFRPDLIVMDILLDHGDGRTLCNLLKSDVQTMDIPILLITAMLESKAREIRNKADALMFKPFDYRILSNKVRELMH